MAFRIHQSRVRSLVFGASASAVGVRLAYGKPGAYKSESQQPQVCAVRHAESVANVIKHRDLSSYHQLSWLDDSDKAQDERLRDCILSTHGITSTLACADGALPEFRESGEVLLVVSPLARTILTASLLFHKLDASRVTVAVEPLAAEVINAPHDLIEDIGRPMCEVFAEAAGVLTASGAPAGARALLGKIQRAAEGLDGLWWYRTAAPGQLPVCVLESGAAERRDALRSAVQRHVQAAGSISRVIIVCHWGVVYTLTGRRDAKNLEFINMDDFWE